MTHCFGEAAFPIYFLFFRRSRRLGRPGGKGVMVGHFFLEPNPCREPSMPIEVHLEVVRELLFHLLPVRPRRQLLRCGPFPAERGTHVEGLPRCLPRCLLSTRPEPPNGLVSSMMIWSWPLLCIVVHLVMKVSKFEQVLHLYSHIVQVCFAVRYHSSTSTS